MNTPDDPRFAGLELPAVGYTIEYDGPENPPNIEEVRILAYDLSDESCRTKTVKLRRPWPGLLVRCSSNMVFLTQRDAQDEIRKMMQKSIPDLLAQLEQQTTSITRSLTMARAWLQNNPL